MKKQFIGLSVAVLMFCGVMSANATPIQWSVADGGNDHWYDTIKNDGITWTSANTEANLLSYDNLDGHLATITSLGENDFIRGVLSGISVVWLGGFQDPGTAEPIADWEWVTGETWGYTNWNPGEPNNALYTPEGEDALTMRGNGLWNDAPTYWASYGNAGYVVEFESAPVPEPATMLLFGTGLIGLAGINKRRKKK